MNPEQRKNHRGGARVQKPESPRREKETKREKKPGRPRTKKQKILLGLYIALTVVAAIIVDPAKYARKDLGVNKPHTDGDKPAWY